MDTDIRVIALYLPQFHPIPENDKWWGKGFTEWMNVGKARSLFRGHYQPRVPADLGYYDLRLSEAREAQAEMAKSYGIEGFCYWHYWFGNGKRLLERPFQEVLSSGKPDFPFCLAWANESWKGFFHGVNGREVLIEQEYPSEQDRIDHFYSVLPAFKDARYMQVDSKPLFMIYNPFSLPDARGFISLWQKLAKENGLAGIHFVGHTYSAEQVNEVMALGFDAVEVVRLFDCLNHRTLSARLITRIRSEYFYHPRIVPYREALKSFIGEEEKDEHVYPTIIPNWDHTPRTGRKGLVFHHSTPGLFKEHLFNVKSVLKDKVNKIVFIKSWNEWAEGNYMEPDLKYGYRYLEKLQDVLELYKDDK